MGREASFVSLRWLDARFELCVDATRTSLILALRRGLELSWLVVLIHRVTSTLPGPPRLFSRC